MDLAPFKAELLDRDNGIARETAAAIGPVADVCDSIYGSVNHSTLMSVAVNYPFAKETQALIKGNSSILETIAPEGE